MEIVGYDERTKISTLRLTDSEFVDLTELLIGLDATDQDYAILGLTPERLTEIKNEVLRLFQERLSYRAGVKT